MKKILFILFIVSLHQNIKAQNITEITNYLYDSIDNRATTFANMSLKNFIDQLKYPVKECLLPPPLPSTPDTVEITRIVLYFEPHSEIISKQIQGYNATRIEVFFTTTQRVPKKYLEKNGILDWTTEWNNKKRDVLGYNIISHLYVR